MTEIKEEWKDPWFETDQGKIFKTSECFKNVKDFRVFDREKFNCIVSDTNPLKPLYELLQFTETEDTFLKQIKIILYGKKHKRHDCDLCY